MKRAKISSTLIYERIEKQREEPAAPPVREIPS